ncbi:hypothetical protein Y1Q_0011274 [Alligator mississippiensis]|uniref:Uncharacterized protein n=1 Tax=Alligator mississippiensis TaxID=8496 RepID=A0A151N805_ALLMI|nr:hypothetical protein Y1Q_0011274 [Alligator mississippiensis]
MATSGPGGLKEGHEHFICTKCKLVTALEKIHRLEAWCFASGTRKITWTRGTNNTARNDTEEIIDDYEALGRRIKELGGQMVFSPILPVEGKDHCILEVNMWLRWWCQCEDLSFFENGWMFLGGGLLLRDGIHLMRMGKSVFGHHLVSLVRRALN